MTGCLGKLAVLKNNKLANEKGRWLKNFQYDTRRTEISDCMSCCPVEL
jgi:hypothetical protein